MEITKEIKKAIRSGFDYARIEYSKEPQADGTHGRMFFSGEIKSKDNGVEVKGTKYYEIPLQKGDVILNHSKDASGVKIHFHSTDFDTLVHFMSAFKNLNFQVWNDNCKGGWMDDMGLQQNSVYVKEFLERENWLSRNEYSLMSEVQTKDNFARGYGNIQFLYKTYSFNTQAA